MWRLLGFIIRGYQLCVSSFTLARCRFYPSCSSYAIEALQRYGIFKGLFLSIKRLCRCHPWGGSGYDPVE